MKLLKKSIRNKITLCIHHMAFVSKEELNIHRLYNAKIDQKEQSRIYLFGQPTNLCVFGAYLEACLRSDCYYLILMTHDLPFEKSVLLYLIDEKLQVVEHIEISDPDGYETYTGMQYQAPNHIKLHFAREWRIQVSILQDKEITPGSFEKAKWVKKQKFFSLRSYFLFQDIEVYNLDEDEYW